MRHPAKLSNILGFTNKATLVNYSKERQSSERIHLTVKAISTNIFIHVNNYIIEKHHRSKGKKCFFNGFQSIF